MENPATEEPQPASTPSPDSGAEAPAPQPFSFSRLLAFDETVSAPPEAVDPNVTRPTPVRNAAASESLLPPEPDHRPDMDATLPTRVHNAAVFDPPPPPPPSGRPATDGSKKHPYRLMTIFGLLALLLVAGISAFSGYNSGIGLRKSAEATQFTSQIESQFNLGVQDAANGYWDRARQRFEWVIRQDPNFPGVTEQLALVLLELNTTATPTLVPTPTLTPTPDLRGVEEMFNQAQQSMADSQWTAAIDSLLLLRKKDPAYRAVDVDGMLFLALRNRGKDKIGKEADLEGGIYDLALAERFGPLDSEAQSFLSWARLYITGASFWELDWKQAVEYFAQIAPQLPNLRDGSLMTAMERYRRALIGYGKTLLNGDDPCAAMEQFETALAIAPDAEAEAALAEATNQCVPEDSGSSDDEPASAEPTAASPTQETPVGEPTAEPTQEPTAEPTAEPTSESPGGEPGATQPSP